MYRVGIAPKNAHKSSGVTDIVAHRGASRDAPENTIAAFELAWKQGADAIEGDFYLTKDRRIVCIHDSSTKRTARANLSVAKSTLAELRKL
ncbi:MAG: glycerophosphodiester phosphodiesterase family protein, partial [Phycisphaerae bacterium]|nr:glycerophosphodiester phosphodiesterase family protein [Phycisphaerae bacterium]